MFKCIARNVIADVVLNFLNSKCVKMELIHEKIKYMLLGETISNEISNIFDQYLKSKINEIFGRNE